MRKVRFVHSCEDATSKERKGLAEDVERKENRVHIARAVRRNGGRCSYMGDMITSIHESSYLK
ncbi:MAG: hypothetical protein OXC62_12245 [Aestuariivita sp.]|nr:hypothetical protein [Aestuariivita sp.]